MRKLILSVAVLVCVAIGCNREPSRKVEVKAPGVSIEVDKSKGIHVDAPGVDVDVSRDEGGANVTVDTGSK